jgi:nucleoside-diphosphate-sugar epimerase
VTAFVAGATGYTGREVVRILAEAKRPVVAHVRHDSPRLDEWRTRFSEEGATIDTTDFDVDALSSTFARLRPDAIFSLLGTTKSRQRATGGSDDYEKVDYGLTHMLIEAAKRSAPRARFVYLSSAGLKPDTTNPYLAVRVRIEAELRASGLDYTSARPSFITGPDRDENRVGEKVGAALADATLAVARVFGAKKLAARYASTTATTLGAALVRLAYDPAAAKRIVESEELR